MRAEGRLPARVCRKVAIAHAHAWVISAQALIKTQTSSASTNVDAEAVRRSEGAATAAPGDRSGRLRGRGAHTVSRTHRGRRMCIIKHVTSELKRF